MGAVNYSDADASMLLEIFESFEDPIKIADLDPRLRDELYRRGLWIELLSKSKAWPDERIRERCKGHLNSDQFLAKDPDVFRIAKARGLMNTLFPRRGRTAPRYWLRARIAKAAAECESRSEFHRKFPGAYRAAINADILDEVCEHMPSPKQRAKNMTDDEIVEFASSFPSPFKFLQADRTIYQQSVRRGLYPLIAAECGWNTPSD